MGRLITVICIVALILGLSLTGVFHARDTKEEFEVRIARAQEFCEQEAQELLVHSAEDMRQLWEAREGFLSFYVRHDEIEKMAMNLVSLQGYAESGSFESAAVVLNQMRFLADHIYQRELPSLDNLF